MWPGILLEPPEILRTSARNIKTDNFRKFIRVVFKKQGFQRGIVPGNGLNC